MLKPKGGPLTKKDIRLEYSGFVIFAAKILSVATGLVFQLMIARATSKSEYDIWFNINDVMVYFTLMAGVLPFWAMRFMAREKKGALKTGILSNLTISAIATLIYLPLVPLVTSWLGVSESYLFLYFLMALNLVEIHSLNMLEACLQARMPHAIGYGLLVQQFCKVFLGYIVIIQLHQPLLGAILATLVAFSIQVLYYSRLLADQLKQKVRWEYVKEWLKGSVANIYNVIGNQISTYIFIMLFAAGEGARGSYGAALQIANVITYSSFLAFALYPKLLAERRSEDVTTSLKTVLMFAIPMTAGAIVLSDSYIKILRQDYPGAAPILVILAIDSFVVVLSGILSSILFGMETVDEKAAISFRSLAKSKLFIAFSLPYFHSAMTIPTAYYVLTTYAENQPVQAAFYVSIINSSARFVMLLVLYAIVHKLIKINVPWKNISKYTLAAAVMAAFLVVVPHPSTIMLTLVVTSIGGIIYLALLMIIDKEARKLPKTMWQEIRKKS